MVQKQTLNLFRKAASVVAPPPKLTVSQWADSHRVLSKESSAEPGKWNTDRAPYQREIMDSISDPDTDGIVVMSSAQVGKSELINNIIGYYIDYDPSPMLLMQPTLEMAEAYSKDRIAPMIRDTPTLTKKVNSPKAKDGNNTLLQKKFAGGHLTLVGANSPAEPNSSGYILEQFLEGELEQGLTLISRFTTNLTDETNNIMDQVNDIIGLPHLDDSGVQEGVIYSKRKRDDTVTQLHEFDATQTNALYPVEQDIQTMKTWLVDLEGLFKEGLTDNHFQTNQWAALTSCNPLLTNLATSTISGVNSMDVEDNDTIIS